MLEEVSLTMMLAVGLLAFPSLPGAPPAPATGHVITVRTVDKGGGKWAFEPSEIQADVGDTVRFLQTDIVPHNVQFKATPKGAHLGDAMMGPFLLQKGQTYDLAIDARFVPGTYRFVCTPHEMLGMKGTLVVASGGKAGGAQAPDPSPTAHGGIR